VKTFPGLEAELKPPRPVSRGTAGLGRAIVDAEQRRQANRLAVEAVKLIGRGRASQAVPLLRRSILLDSSVAATHHDLGVALLSLAKLEEAAVAFRSAVRLDPELASAWHNLGHALDNTGRQDEALTAFEKAVALNPGLASAQSRLGDVYIVRGRRAEAVAALRALVESTSDPVHRRMNEARIKDAEGDLNEAVSLLGRLSQEIEENGELHLHLARMLARAGRLDEAADHFERAATAAPNLAIAWYGLATVYKFTAADQSLINKLNACLARPKLTPLDREVIHFALGKAHDDIGRYDIAIRNFDAANGLRSRRAGFDVAAHARRVDRILAGASPETFIGRAGLKDPTPILVVGMPRSGTTLIEQIFSSHPEVAAGGEMSFWTERDTPESNLLNAGEAADLALAEDYIAALRDISPTATRVTDKMPLNFGLAGVIHRMLPEATIVHCRRHPIDTCLSIYTTSFEAGMDFAADRVSLVAFYRQYERLMAHWRGVLPRSRFIEVQYEDLVDDPEPETRRLVAACGLEWDDACLSPHQNKRQVATASLWQARQPIYKSSVERWRRYEPWLGELRQLAPDMKRS